MALRFSSKAAAIVEAGTSFTLALPKTPDEWSINLRGPSPGAAALYVVSAPTSRAFVVAASGAAGTGDVFVSVVHSFVR